MIVVIGLLVSLFITSSIVSIQKSKEGLIPPSAEQILEYAGEFLEDSAQAELGKRIDCSGYTRRVFGNFNIEIGASAARQFEACEPVLKKDLHAGNLMFFNTSGAGISHVAISIDSLLFIHSPGNGRYVKIDSLTHTYWSSRFVAAGKIRLEKSK